MKLKIKFQAVANWLTCLKYAVQMKLRELRGFVAQEQQQNQTETWPAASGTTPGFVVKGDTKTNIQWGTNGSLASPNPGSGLGFYTVLRISEKPILDRTKLPNGNGLTTSDVMIQDGMSWEVTVRDDSTLTTQLRINMPVTIVDLAGLLGTKGYTYTARVLDTNYETAVKQAGERGLQLESLLLIDSQTGTAQAGN